MAKVTFDYSKANLFIREHEMESMKDIVLAAKDKLLHAQEQEMISLDGSTFRKIMIKMSLREFRKRQIRSRQIPTYFL